MTAQKGKDLLLKVDTNGAGSFVTVAGLRARTLAFNAATVDGPNRWSVKLAATASLANGKLRMSFGGVGILRCELPRHRRARHPRSGTTPGHSVLAPRNQRRLTGDARGVERVARDEELHACGRRR